MVEMSMEVEISRLKIRLLEVRANNLRQLVAGGRLVIEEKDGEKKTHPDLPAYGKEMFPVPLEDWDKNPVVTVSVYKNGVMCKCSCVRAETLLFNPFPPDTVRNWIRSSQ